VRRVAPRWLRALPPSCETAAGYSSACLVPGLAFRVVLSWSWVPLQSSFVAKPPACRLRSDSLTRPGTFLLAGSASPELLAPRTQRLRSPRLTRRCPRAASLWAKVARPSPVPSSGLVPSRRFWLRQERRTR